MNNSETLATLGTQGTRKRQTNNTSIYVGHHNTVETRRRQTQQKTQHNVCWILLYANKHK
jgi:hypothetical protein